MSAIKVILAALATGVAAVPSIDCLASNSHKQPIVSNYNRNNENNGIIVNDLREKTAYVNKLSGMVGNEFGRCASYCE